MSKYIEFRKLRMSDSGKTQIWEVLPKAGPYPLGEIRWFGRWRKYSFYPDACTVFEQDCLRKIADFCENESKKLRKTWKR